MSSSHPLPQPIHIFRPTSSSVDHPHSHHPKTTILPARSITHLEFIDHHHPRIPDSSRTTEHHLSLLTTDNHGWISIWNLASKRIQSFWHPHPSTQSNGGCLWATSLMSSSHQSIIHPNPSSSPPPSSLFILSQGRDHKLKLNEILVEDHPVPSLSTTIIRAHLRPSLDSPSKNVRIVCEASINSINFCKASRLQLPSRSTQTDSKNPTHDRLLPPQPFHSLVALPSLITEQLVDIFAIQIDPKPDIIRIYQGVGRGSGDRNQKNHQGSAVSLELYSPPGARDLVMLLIGYESGEMAVFKLEREWSSPPLAADHYDPARRMIYPSKDWQTVGVFKGHSEPILSMATSIDRTDRLAGIGWSVGADRNIARYHMSTSLEAEKADLVNDSMSPGDGVIRSRYRVTIKVGVFRTNQAGRFDIKVRSDGKVLGIYHWGGQLWLFDPDPKKVGVVNEEEQQPEAIQLRPLGLFKLPSDPEHRSGILAFSPFYFSSRSMIDRPDDHDPTCSSIAPSLPTPVEWPPPHDRLDSLIDRALLLASGPGALITAWEVFPP